MIAWLGYTLADSLVRVLPRGAADALAVGVARALFALRPPARRAVEANLARLTVTSAGAIHARATFEHFALAFVDFLRLRRLDAAALARATEVRGAEHLAAARAAGRGVIVLSAHLGSWERGAALLAGQGARLRIAARAHADARVERFFAGCRGRHGVARLAGEPLWSDAASALRRHEWVALMGDRTVEGSHGSVCAWASALARRTGALVLPAVVVRRPEGGWALCVDAPLTPEACAAGGLRAALRGWIERHPEQWSAFEPLAEGIA
jgi:lauroyl/myristoyl acyltransferase